MFHINNLGILLCSWCKHHVGLDLTIHPPLMRLVLPKPIYQDILQMKYLGSNAQRIHFVRDLSVASTGSTKSKPHKLFFSNVGSRPRDSNNCGKNSPMKKLTRGLLLCPSSLRPCPSWFWLKCWENIKVRERPCYLPPCTLIAQKMFVWQPIFKLVLHFLQQKGVCTSKI